MILVFELTDKNVFEKYIMFEMLKVCNQLMTGSVQEIISEVGEFVPSASNSEILTYLAWAQG